MEFFGRRRRIGLLALALCACGDDLPDPQASTASTGPVDLPTSTGLPMGLDGSGSDETTAGTTTDESEIPWDGEWPTLECDPIVPELCGFPFPNNVFTVADPETLTGRRVTLSPAMLPVADGGSTTTPDVFNRRDGFSAGIALLTQLPRATTQGLPRPDSIEGSLEPDSPTVLLDTVTGERVAHWAELDMTTNDEERQAFMIRPVVRLEDDRRYIVAIRGVVDQDGAPLAPSPAFAALRDRTPSDDPAVESRRGLYTDIFGQLEAAGVARDDLQQAWDFSTASMEDNTGWLVGMRDETLEMMSEGGPPYTIDSVDVYWSSGLMLRILGRMVVPLYLDQPGVGGVINLGPDGRPARNGTAEYPFEVLIPETAYDEPAPVVQYGHGLFNDHRAVEWQYGVPNTYNVVLFAVDWLGMSEQDAIPTANVLATGDLAAFDTLPSRLLQAQINALLAMRMVTGNFAEDPALHHPWFGLQDPIDPSERYYFGVSLGGILGSVYMALSPDVERGALGVPGQSFNLLMSRSIWFAPFLTVLESFYDDPRDIQMIQSIVMLLWDRAEPTGFSRHIRDGALGTSPHEVLMQVAIGDHQVTNYGSHIMARTIGLPLLTPAPRSVWGLDEVTSGHTGSAMIEYDFGLPPIPLDNVPMQQGQDPHGRIWQQPQGHDTLFEFLRTGQVHSYCDGACDPQ